MNTEFRISILNAIDRYCTEHTLTPYIVGGAVRDALSHTAGKTLQSVPICDIDIALVVEARPFSKRIAVEILLALTQYITELYSGKYIYTEAYQTTKTTLSYMEEHIHIDFALTRTEEYPHIGANPIIFIGDVHAINIEKDLERRDFTCNAIALPVKKYILYLQNALLSPSDYTCLATSLQDITEGRIQVLHAKSFYDDPTRIIRMFTYMQQFLYTIESSTYKAFQNACNTKVFYTISAERLFNALEHSFKKVSSLSELISLYIQYNLFSLLFETPTSTYNIPEHIHYLEEYKYSPIPSSEQKIASTYSILAQIRYFEEQNFFTLCNAKERLFLLYSILYKHSLANIQYNKSVVKISARKEQEKARPLVNSLNTFMKAQDNALQCQNAYSSYCSLSSESKKVNITTQIISFCIEHSILELCYILLQDIVPHKIILEEYLFFKHTKRARILFSEKDIPYPLSDIRKKFYRELQTVIFLEKIETKEAQILQATKIACRILEGE